MSEIPEIPEMNFFYEEPPSAAKLAAELAAELAATRNDLAAARAEIANKDAALACMKAENEKLTKALIALAGGAAAGGGAAAVKKVPNPTAPRPNIPGDAIDFALAKSTELGVKFNVCWKHSEIGDPAAPTGCVLKIAEGGTLAAMYATKNVGCVSILPLSCVLIAADRQGKGFASHVLQVPPA